MTVNPETGEFLNDTDGLLRDRMIPVFGAEGTKRFFESLEPLTLQKRLKAITRAIKMLALLDREQIQPSPIAVVETDTVATVTAMPIQAFEQETVGQEPLVGAPLTDIYVDAAHVETEAASLDGVVDLDIEETPELIDKVISKSFRQLIDDIAGEGTADQLELMQSDKQAVIAAVFEMNQPLDKRMKPDLYKTLLSGVYEGLNNPEISQKLMNELGLTISSAAISQRKGNLKERAIEQSQIAGKIPADILKEFVMKGRGTELEAKSLQASSDIVTNDELAAMASLQNVYEKSVETLPLEEITQDDELPSEEQLPASEDTLADQPLSTEIEPVQLDEPDYSIPTISRPPVTPLTMARLRPLNLNVESAKVYEKREAESLPSLWDVARGEAEMSHDNWEIARAMLFDEAVKAKQLSREEAVLVKLRMDGEDNTKDIDPKLRGALRKFQELATSPGISLEDDPDAKQIFNMFTMTVFGANTIDDITIKVNREREKTKKKAVRNKFVTRKLTGAIAHVLEEDRK